MQPGRGSQDWHRAGQHKRGLPAAKSSPPSPSGCVEKCWMKGAACCTSPIRPFYLCHAPFFRGKQSRLLWDWSLCGRGFDKKKIKKEGWIEIYYQGKLFPYLHIYCSRSIETRITSASHQANPSWNSLIWCCLRSVGTINTPEPYEWKIHIVISNLCWK